MSEPSLFVWRSQVSDRVAGICESEFRNLLPEWPLGSICPYCSHEWHVNSWYEMKCKVCGFWYEDVHDFLSDLFGAIEIDYEAFAILKEFSINDSSLSLNELGSYLNTNISDIYSISPRKFEEIVADIYRNLGFNVRLTKQSRDGGFDVVLTENSSGDQIIVECKRYSKQRNISVGIVRQVLGVQVLHRVQRAKIVTTSKFTNPALQEAKTANLKSEYEIELVDIDDISQALGLYHKELPNPSIMKIIKNSN